MISSSAMGQRHPLGGQVGDEDDLTAFIRRSTLDAYATVDRMAAITRVAPSRRYPATRLAAGLEEVSRMIKAGTGALLLHDPGWL